MSTHAPNAKTDHPGVARVEHAAATIIQGDWLDVAAALPPNSVDMLYADPPFNTGARKSASAGSFDDSWPTRGEFVGFLRARLSAALPALKNSACVLLHLDQRTSHVARVMLDELLGEDRFVNHIIWHYGLGGSSPRRFARKHDDILFYCLDTERYYFDPPRVPATSARMRGMTKKASDVLAIPSINNMAAERVGYPTQKPRALLDILVRACCPEGGLVFDPCCGSGTTLEAAINAGRRAIGCDISADAVAVARKRLDRTKPPTRT